MALSAHPDNPQMIEQHIWRVVYDDGSEFCEYPSPTEHHSFLEVDLDRVRYLIVEPNHWLDAAGSAFQVYIGEDMTPIMHRTVALVLQTGASARWHVFGWQKKANGVSVKSLTYVSNDDPFAPVMHSSEPLQVG